MSNKLEVLKEVKGQEYKYGFVTDIESDKAPIGLSEDIVRLISRKKKEPKWLLDWRLKAFRYWQTLEETEPKWAHIKYDGVDFQNIIYYAAPKEEKGAKKLR